MKKTFGTIMAACLAATLMSPLPVAAQQAAGQAAPAGQAVELSGFWLTAPYPELAIKPGETESISLSLRNEKLPPQRAAIKISGVPQDWDWALKGGGKEVSAAIVGPDTTERLTLELTPPAEAAADKSYPIEVRARTGAETVALPLTVRLSEEETTSAASKLEPELPALRGTARSTFSFKVNVSNDSGEDGLFNLAADVPTGFQTRFKKGYGSEEIAGLPIAAGASERLRLQQVTMDCLTIPLFREGSPRMAINQPKLGLAMSEATEGLPLPGQRHSKSYQLATAAFYVRSRTEMAISTSHM